ncbi:MAG: ubiquinone/menaquinone biosynthesis methyltransferase [Planctomycetes bacterium]|nr:ubiquinone/menaquinone biosynthesis methyltransferase [Planctomycetota bacterium]
MGPVANGGWPRYDASLRLPALTRSTTMPAPSDHEKDPGAIRDMFAAISPRYDLLNHTLSLNVDRRWRRRVARELRLPPGALCLDVCTGTADLALELASSPGAPRVVGADFTREMLRIGEAKRRRRRAASVSLVLADTLALPFADGTFDAVTVAFGIRNVASLEAGIGEMRRVLRPGGRAAVLEFAELEGRWLRRAFRLYFHGVLPRLGAWISGSRSGARAYSYLPRSVGEFPAAGELRRTLERCGLTEARTVKLTFGIACLHVATRPPEPQATPHAPPRLAAAADASSGR